VPVAISRYRLELPSSTSTAEAMPPCHFLRRPLSPPRRSTLPLPSGLRGVASSRSHHHPSVPSRPPAQAMLHRYLEPHFPGKGPPFCSVLPTATGAACQHRFPSWHRVVHQQAATTRPSYLTDDRHSTWPSPHPISPPRLLTRCLGPTSFTLGRSSSWACLSARIQRSCCYQFLNFDYNSNCKSFPKFLEIQNFIQN
jgi:hypothetical protein